MNSTGGSAIAHPGQNAVFSGSAATAVSTATIPLLSGVIGAQPPSVGIIILFICKSSICAIAPSKIAIHRFKLF